MAQFKAFQHGVEISGDAVLSVIDGFVGSKEKSYNILSEHGIHNPQPGKWYLQQSWLNAFETIANDLGPSTLFSIGRKIPQNAIFPKEIDNIEKALASIDKAYHMNHRNGEIGNYVYEKTGDKSVRMVCKNPYPCDFDRGIIQEMASRFKPRDCYAVSVTHDNSAPCRKKGHHSCTYHVNW